MARWLEDAIRIHRQAEENERDPMQEINALAKLTPPAGPAAFESMLAAL
jgi:hypothetical protein